MIKIRKFKEEFYDGLKIKPPWNKDDYYEVFKNPSIRELNEAGKNDTRGVLFLNGDLYVVVGNSFDFIHESILFVLNKLKLIESKWLKSVWINNLESFNYFLCITRIKEEYIFNPAESYKIQSIKLNILEKYAQVFHKKNPYYYMNLDNTKVYDY